MSVLEAELIVDPMQREALRERLLKPSEVARVYGVTPRTLGNWIRARRIKAQKTPGGQYRLKGSDVEALLCADDTQNEIGPAGAANTEQAQ